MGALVDVVVGTTVAGAAVTGSVALHMRSRMHRALRLVPGRRVDVPLRWRWSWRRAPLLHRRLQRACQVVIAATASSPTPPVGVRRWRRRRPQDPSILQTTAGALIEQAIVLDRRLVAADRGGPAWRRLHLPGLASEVAALEVSCVRLAQLSRSLDDHLDTVTGRGHDPRPEMLLDAMEAALADLRASEQAAQK